MKKSISGIIVGSIAVISVEDNFRNHGSGRKYTRGTAEEVARGQLRTIADTSVQLLAAGVIESGFSEIRDGLKAKAKEIGGLKKDADLRSAYRLLAEKIDETATGDEQIPDQTMRPKPANGSGAEHVGGHPA